MMVAPPRGVLPWATAGIAVALAAGLAAETLPAAWAPPQDDLPIAAKPAAGAPVAAAPPIAAWADIALARPLFAPNRRPPASAASPTEALPRLAGTIRFAQTALAIFQPAAGAAPGGRPVVLGQGASVSGWIVGDITDGGVTLERGGRTEVLRLGYAVTPTGMRKLPLRAVTVLHDKRTSVFLQP
jgi:hypothetical protein